jgi:pilus assembly protein CpaE
LTKYQFHFFELLESTDRLDAELLQSFVMHHASGVDIIPAPAEIESARNVSPGSVSRTFDFLRLRYEFILVDMPPVLNDENFELIRQCDQLYIVTVAEVSALRNVVRQIEYLTRKQIPQEKIRVVLNRHQTRGLITDEQIEKAIQRKIFWKVPNHYVHVLKTISGGNPGGNNSSSEVIRNLSEWAEVVSRKATDEQKDRKKSRGILKLWGR